MKIGVDAQLAVGTATGIGEYVTGLIAALRSADADVVALSNSRLDPWRFDRRVLWDQVQLSRAARRAGVDVLHCASGTMPLYAGVPMVATVHDVAWLRVQAHARPYARAYFGRFALRRYRAARSIAIDSDFSRGELLALLPGYDPDRVHVVYPGVAADYGTLSRASDRRTILAVGTIEARKNLELLIRALTRLPHARLVAVGPPTPYFERCRDVARECGVEARVEFRGYVDRDSLLALYATCAVVAVPSRYEGFGYAAAQALCAGAPCVVSDCGSLPEIAGGDARVVPLEEDAWADALQAGLDGALDGRAESSRSNAIARFGWEASARAMLAIYASAVS